MVVMGRMVKVLRILAASLLGLELGSFNTGKG